MTGFGRTSFDADGKSITVEIRTLNSKQLDLSTRISPLFRNRENEIRSLIARKLERGKIDFSLSLDANNTPDITVNKNLAASYYKALSELSDELCVASNDAENANMCLNNYLQVLRMPDVISTPTEELSDDLWASILDSINITCEQVNSFRESEGNALAEDFKKRICLIRNMLGEVTPFEESRIETIRTKFENSLQDLSNKVQYDPNRLEQEIFYYLEKLDITEEKVRLLKHCSYFLETMSEPQANGKKLGFIAQECGREINTLGSKSNNFDIQQIVVRMKDELEKLKEQLANIL